MDYRHSINLVSLGHAVAPVYEIEILVKCVFLCSYVIVFIIYQFVSQLDRYDKLKFQNVNEDSFTL